MWARISSLGFHDIIYLIIKYNSQITLTTMTYGSHTMGTTVKVSADTQNGREKTIVTNFDVRLESAYYFITHFSQLM